MKKINLILLFITMLSTSSCLKEFDDLGYNLLEDDSVVLISVTDSDVFYNPPLGTGSIDITFQLSSVYEDFTPEQKGSIVEIHAFNQNGTLRAKIPATAKTMVIKGHEVFQYVCYYFAFVNRSGDISRLTTKNNCFQF